MREYRHLLESEIECLRSQACYAEDWNNVTVAPDFEPSHVFSTRFSGSVRLGSFKGSFSLPGGMTKHSGLYHTQLHNVEIGDDCCIENVKNYISNYRIGDRCFIENVDIILTDGNSSFGNGVEVSVMNETGGREVVIYDRLSAQQAYMLALYRHRPAAMDALKRIIGRYVDSVRSETGTIGNDVTIADTGYIKNVKIGDCCKIEGTSRLKNGSINSNSSAPVHIGVNVIGDDFIICSGSHVDDGVMFSRCFIGQACVLGHGYSASDSLFFGNCQGENGEACAIFAGPFTVTHHKSTLLIAGMFSFMNAGSGSNQSNHMYKLGPIHQGIMERGAKTASDSYILWPSRVGAFSLVMGRHVQHQDTSDLPFSYLIEQQGVSFIMPGANLKSVGTIRDARKWPQRDKRADGDRLDCINYNLLSPYTVQKMLDGKALLERLRKISGEDSDTYSYQSGKIKNSSLRKGLLLYSLAIDKFLGNSLISRMTSAPAGSFAELKKLLVPTTSDGEGRWVDVAGMIAPKSCIESLVSDIESGEISSETELGKRFASIHSRYYDFEWTWASKVIESYYGIDLQAASKADLEKLILRWKESVVTLDNMVHEDAGKEFSLSAMTSFGADGSAEQRREDFLQVRGASFENDPFVRSISEHIQRKSALCDETLALLRSLE